MTLEDKLEKLFEENKNTFYINGTGNYGDPYKKRVIENYNLSEKHATMIMSLSYGTVRKFVEDYNNEKGENNG